MDDIVNKFKFDWSGLDEFIYDLNLTNYVGRSNKFTYVELPGCAKIWY